ncbi:MAG TPA: glycosyltransferase family 39 protein [Ktedonobacterales bacterium]|nr:glycosyltransferase family 39 protein [Ktedonobacterales bacterium]
MVTQQARARGAGVARVRDGARAARMRQGGLLAAGGAVLALCVFFHVYRLGATPGWDPQEGYNLDIAWNLLHGRLRLFALTSAFAQHPPLFYLQLALAIRVFGYSIVAVRALAALYAILTCAVLLLAGRRMLGAGPALWAALVFTVAPITLANTRWGYSYAQLACVGVFCLWAGWRYAESGERRWLLAAAALAGLAAFSDYVGVAWIVFVALLALRRAWRDAALAAGVGFGILAAGLLACLVAAPAIFVSDVVTTSGRAAGGNPLLQVILLLLNYYRFLTLDPWLLLGVVGLFLVPARTRGYLLGAAVVLGLVVLKVRDLGTSIHTAVPLLPILALGAGVALDAGLRRLYAWSLDWLRPLIPASPTSSVSPASHSSDRHPGDQPHPLLRRQVATLLVFLVVVSPLGLATAADAVGLGGTLTTRQDDILATPGDARAAGRYVLAHAHSGDLVLASPTIAWMFDAPEGGSGGGGIQGADILQSISQAGDQAAFYPAHLPADRWAYDVAPDRARYVVVDDLLRRLATPGQAPALQPILARVERWPVAFTAGQYTVYERPAIAIAPGGPLAAKVRPSRTGETRRHGHPQN